MKPPDDSLERSGRMTTWVYFATAERASLADTLGTVINDQFLWRSGRNVAGHKVANVQRIVPRDRILLAWRAPNASTRAYLLGVVAEPLNPVEPGMVIDRIAGRAAKTMVRAGYPRQPDDTVEGIRLDEVQECWMDLRGIYPGRNAIHKLADADLARLADGQPIPPEVVAKRPSSQPILTVDRLGLTADVAPEHRAFDAYVMVDCR